MVWGMAAEPRIGTKIRRARKRKRWTQQQLADALKVSRITVDSWENDRAYPRNEVAIEEVLGISLSGPAPDPYDDAYAGYEELIRASGLSKSEQAALLEAHRKAVEALRREGVRPGGEAPAAEAQPE
jgi:transcriptional regulator with XRE-family HTH domain